MTTSTLMMMMMMTTITEILLQLMSTIWHLAIPRHEKREVSTKKRFSSTKEKEKLFIFSTFTTVVNKFNKKRLSFSSDLPQAQCTLHTVNNDVACTRRRETVHSELTLPPARHHIAVVTQNRLFCARGSRSSHSLFYCD